MVTSLSRASFHEAGHCLAIVLAFRNAAWLPRPPPPVLIRDVAIWEAEPGEWVGRCRGASIYPQLSGHRLADHRYIALAEAEVAIRLAGGLSEAIHRNVRGHLLRFAKDFCGIGTDLAQCVDVADDLRRIGRYHEAQIIDSTGTMLLKNWASVEALAAALIDQRRITGDQVERIIENTTGG